VWMKNVRNYVEETETYILNDEHAHQEIVDDGWAFFVRPRRQRRRAPPRSYSRMCPASFAEQSACEWRRYLYAPYR